MWSLPGPGIRPVSPALAGRFLTTGEPCPPILNTEDSALQWPYVTFFPVGWALGGRILTVSGDLASAHAFLWQALSECWVNGLMTWDKQPILMPACGSLQVFNKCSLSDWEQSLRFPVLGGFFFNIAKGYWIFSKSFSATIARHHVFSLILFTWLFLFTLDFFLIVNQLYIPGTNITSF